MKPSSKKHAEWERTIARVQKGMTKPEAGQILGPPSRTVSKGTTEILAYQAEQIGDAISSIRVAFTDGRVEQCYMGYEWCEGDARNRPQKLSERLQLFLVVLIAAIAFLLFYWLKTR